MGLLQIKICSSPEIERKTFATKKEPMKAQNGRKASKKSTTKRGWWKSLKKHKIFDLTVWEIYAVFFFNGKSSCPKRPLSSRLQSFWMLKAKASRKNCVSTLPFPRVRNRRKRKSCFNTPNTPSTCMERFVLKRLPSSLVMFPRDSALSRINSGLTLISRYPLVLRWHFPIWGHPSQLWFL